MLPFFPPDAHGCRSLPSRLRLRLEVLEDRTALSWAGVPPSTITPPTNAVPITLNAQRDAQGNATIAANENDFYSFRAPATGNYRLSALTPASNLNTVLGLFSATGRRLAFNDNLSSANRDSQLTTRLTAGERYYFAVTNYSGTPRGAYVWQVDGPPPVFTDDGFENNDSLAQASNLGTLTARRTLTNLVMADGADWFRFTTTAAATAAHSVAITFQHSRGNLDLELYSATGTRLRLSAGTGNSETISLNNLDAGTYYVRVSGLQGAVNPAYTLDVVAPPTLQPGLFDIVVRVNGLTASQRAIFDRAAARWELIITGELPDATYQGGPVDDLLIDAVAVAIDGPGNIFGQAGPDTFRSGSGLPIHGVMEFDSADLATLEANGQLYDVILHEMGHVLGIGVLWPSMNLLSGAGTTNPRFLGARATAEYNALFRTADTSVPVEGRPAEEGSRDNHWREAVFGVELMTPTIFGTRNPISRVTVGSLADMGYVVNMSAADAYVPPV